jgi:hypothetical protein
MGYGNRDKALVPYTGSAKSIFSSDINYALQRGPAEWQAQSRFIAEYCGEPAAKTFNFDDVKRQTNRIRSLQRRLHNELQVDSSDMLVRMKQALLKKIRDIRGEKEQTLQDLFNEEAKEIDSLCRLLGSLWGACYGNHTQLFDYFARNNEQLAGMCRQIPLLRADDETASQEHRNIFDRYARMDDEDPEFFLLQTELARARNNKNQSRHYLAMARDTKDLLNGMNYRVDIVSQIMLYGKDFSELLGERYIIVKDCLSHLAPAVDLIRGLFKQSDELCELIVELTVGLDKAYQVESEFENRRLVSKAYDVMPLLPPRQGTADILNYVNDQFGGSNARRLIR